MKKSIYIVGVLAVLALALTPAVFAQAPGSTITPTGGIDANALGTQGTVTSTGTLVDAILGLVYWLAWFISLAAVVLALISGFLFITSAGDEAKLKKAKGALLLSIIVVVVAILSFSIVSIARSIVNF